MFPLQVSRAITTHVILGLQELHERAVIHGGKTALSTIWDFQASHLEDLHPRNILFPVPLIDTMSVEEIYQKSIHQQRPKSTGSTLLQLAREHRHVLLSPSGWGPYANTSAIHVYTYLTSAKLGSTPTSHLGRIYTFHGPTFLPEPLSRRIQLGFLADVWTLACSIHEIMGQRSLLSWIEVLPFLKQELNGSYMVAVAEPDPGRSIHEC